MTPQQYIKVRPYIDSDDAKFVPVRQDNPSPTTRFIRTGCSVDNPNERNFVAVGRGGKTETTETEDKSFDAADGLPSVSEKEAYRNSLKQFGLGPGDEVNEIPADLRPSNQDFNHSRAVEVFFSVKYS